MEPARKVKTSQLIYNVHLHSEKSVRWQNKLVSEKKQGRCRVIGAIISLLQKHYTTITESILEDNVGSFVIP